MTEPTVPPPPFSGEVVGPPEPAGRGGRGRRVVFFGAVAAVVVGLLGGAAFAAYQFLNGGGPRPEDALPDSTFAEVSIDLNPHAGQKIEAIKTMRKFPALRENLGLESQDDLREFIFEEVLKAGDCDDVDYAKDIEPWIGKRAAFAGVALPGDEMAPTIALQIEDPAKARAGMDKVVACTGADDFFFTFGEDYLIASDSQQHADAIMAAGKKAPLADDPAFQKWTDRVGEQGVVSFYVSAKAPQYLADELDSMFGSALDATAGASAPSRVRSDSDPSDVFRDALEGFKGMAGTLRFADGGMELSVAAGGALTGGDKGAPTVGKEVGALPGDTALALGYGIPEDLADQVMKYVGDDSEFQGFLDEAESRTGLDLPGDVQTLLGHAVTLSLGGDAPKNLDESTGPEDFPVGLVLHTDADKAEDIIETAERNLGVSLDDIPVTTEKTGSMLVLSPSSDYAKQLTENGSLGDTGAFRDAVPDADQASVILFATIDSDWREAIAELAASDLRPGEVEELEENLKPLEAIGLSTKVDGEDGVFRLRVSTR